MYFCLQLNAVLCRDWHFIWGPSPALVFLVVSLVTLCVGWPVGWFLGSQHNCPTSAFILFTYKVDLVVVEFPFFWCKYVPSNSWNVPIVPVEQEGIVSACFSWLWSIRCDLKGCNSQYIQTAISPSASGPCIFHQEFVVGLSILFIGACFIFVLCVCLLNNAVISPEFHDKRGKLN